MNLNQVDLIPSKGGIVEMVLSDPDTVAMLLPKVERVIKCRIKHHSGVCYCKPPVVVDASKIGACEDAAMYVLGAIRKKGEPGKLSDEDLIFLATRAAVMAGHWGRLALGQQDLR